MTQPDFKCRMCDMDHIIHRGDHLVIHHRDFLKGFFDKNVDSEITIEKLQSQYEDLSTAFKGMAALDGPIAKMHDEVKSIENRVIAGIDHLVKRANTVDTTLQAYGSGIENLQNNYNYNVLDRFKKNEKRLDELEYDDRKEEIEDGDEDR